jgi:hypothetical protein
MNLFHYLAFLPTFWFWFWSFTVLVWFASGKKHEHGLPSAKATAQGASSRLGRLAPSTGQKLTHVCTPLPEGKKLAQKWTSGVNWFQSWGPPQHTDTNTSDPRQLLACGMIESSHMWPYNSKGRGWRCAKFAITSVTLEGYYPASPLYGCTYIWSPRDLLLKQPHTWPWNGDRELWSLLKPRSLSKGRAQK